MKSFLKKVNAAIISMGKAPYDDKKTIEAISKATEKTVGCCDKLRKTNTSK